MLADPVRPSELYSGALSGIQPVDVEDRTERHFIKLFFVWFSASTTIVACVAPSFPSLTSIGGPTDEVWYCCRFASGTLGPIVFKLSLAESCLCIFFMNLIFSIYPSYL